MDRRSFLKLGAASSAILTTVSMTATLSGCSSESVSVGGQWRVLRADDRVFLTAVMPVILKGNFPEGGAQQDDVILRILQGIDLAIFNLGPHNAKQIEDLFTLLNFSLSRGLSTGVWSNWDQASETEINDFFE